MKTLATFIAVLCLAVGLIIGLVLAKPKQVTPAPQPPAATSTPSYSTGDWKKYNDGFSDKMGSDMWRYSLKYPRDFDFDSGYTDVLSSSTAARFSFPKDAFESEYTNFAEGWVTTSFQHPSTEKECYPQAPVVEWLLPDETINGVKYRVWEFGDAAAGNFYATKQYRTYFPAQQTCFEIDETLHTTNVGAYDPGTVTEFDKSKAQKYFDQIVDSIRFTTH